MLDFKDDPVPAYEDDFILWLESQAAFLHADRAELLDRDNLFDELISMANRDRRELKSRLKVLLAHLLKCQFQADHKKHSWEHTVDEQRSQIRLILDDSPSLRSSMQNHLETCYQQAVRQAARETGMPAPSFPAHAPYSVEQLLDDGFLP